MVQQHLPEARGGGAREQHRVFACPIVAGAVVAEDDRVTIVDGKLPPRFVPTRVQSASTTGCEREQRTETHSLGRLFAGACSLGSGHC